MKELNLVLENLHKLHDTTVADIEGTITVERDNITIDGLGHRLWGTGGFSGFDLNGRTGVTIRRTIIDSFFNGIRLAGSNGNSIYGNNITNSWYGIWFSASNSNRFFRNNFVANAYHAYMDTLCCNSSNFWDNGVEGGSAGANDTATFAIAKLLPLFLVIGGLVVMIGVGVKEFS